MAILVNKAKKNIVVGILLSAMLVPGAYSGQLRRFERSATDRQQVTSERTRSILDLIIGDIIGDIIGSFFHHIFISIISEPIGIAVDDTKDRIDSGMTLGTGENSWPRRIGDPDLPFVRVDLHYQHINSNLIGLDGRLEAGHGPLGLQVRHTRYNERDPNDSLGLTSIHGLLRLSWSEKWEAGLGIGAAFLGGEGHSSGFSVMYPINWHPHRKLNLRFAPTFSWLGGDPISDFDLSFGYIHQYWSFRSGYRWLISGDETIDSPYIGVSFHY